MTNLKLSCLFSFAFCVVVVARGEWISGSYQMPAETNLAAFFKPAPNDYGYFPTANAYQEGGYEAWASIFDPTVSEDCRF